MPAACSSAASRSSRFVPLAVRRGAKRPRAGAAKVWSADDELAAARAMAGARVELWLRLLEEPRRVALAQTAVERPDVPAVREGLDRLALACRDAAGRRDFAAAVAELAPVIADADRDLALATVLVRAQRRGAAAHASLWTAWDALQACRRDFATANLRLVSALARRFGNRGVDAEDLVQEGNLGLLRAVDRYDHRLGFRFSTYAVWWVRHAIERAIRNRGSLVRIAVPTQDALFRLARTRAELERAEGRRPSDEELAAAGFSEAMVRRLDRASMLTSVVPLHPIAFGGRRSPVLADDAEGAEALLGRHELEAFATSMLEHLRPREADVLRRRFGLDGPEETLAQIGATLGTSRERVRQIQNVALQRLRAIMAQRDRELDLAA